MPLPLLLQSLKTSLNLELHFKPFTNFIEFVGDDEVLLPSKLKNDNESLTLSST